MLQDLRYTVRTLIKAPAFTIVAVLTLAAGIGATVGIFTVVNAVLLRPLPIRESGRVGVITAEEPKTRREVGASWTKYLVAREQNQVFEDVGAYVDRQFTFSDGANPEQVPGARVTASFFSALGVNPALGRNFFHSEDVENASPAVIVTDAFWRRRLAADPDIISKAITIDGRRADVVGVLPPDFRFQFSDREPQLYLTQVFTPGALTAVQISTGAGFLEYVARLKPGVTFATAKAELATIDGRYQQTHGSNSDAGRFVMRLVPLADSLVGDVRSPLFVLMGAVCLVLLVACANVAHLLLARSAVRQREIAVRLSIGASRARLIRQFLTESLMLSIMGSALGIAAARAAVSLLVAYGPSNIPRLADAGPDVSVLIFSIATSCVTAIVFGIMPAVRASGINVNDVLKDGRAGGLTGRAAGRLHNLLAASESAVTVTLVVAAALLFQSLVRMQAIDPGFDPRGVYTAHVELPRGTYPAPAQREAFFTELLGRLQAVPGLRTVGATSYLPMSNSNYGFFFFVEGQASQGARDPVISVRHVSPDYFRAMHIPLRRGRTFTAQDDARSAPVTIINETTARRYFPGVDPIGRHVASSGDRIMREIVGIVSDVRFDGPARSGQEELYLPYRQVPWQAMSIVVDSALPADQVVAALRAEVKRVDPDQAVAATKPMDAVLAASMTQQRFTSSLLGTFAVLALSLAGIGLYGVITLFVTQRRHEFGIRMALGAQPGDVVRMVMGQGLRVIAAGVGVGIIGAVAAARLLSGLLFGISALNPATYLLAAVTMGLIGVVACYIPARRAVSVDPLRALRWE